MNKFACFFPKIKEEQTLDLNDEIWPVFSFNNAFSWYKLVNQGCDVIAVIGLFEKKLFEVK
ncbi:hypothetical protein SAE01_31680 [Segetibacter aerophilus]|uniref:Uncharacterized protein n=1 Tax=Segetibacter aerophilus TaxID=670293 RepID=A0A512BFD8_9BACT|nr:hypothetical protein SAE01_31680 [Segetibacter aerophilus]